MITFGDHSDFEDYLSYYKSDIDHWSDHSHLKSYLSHHKVAVITYSVDKIILFVAMFTFVVAEMTFKVMVPFVVKITFVVTEITFLGTDMGLLVAKITCCSGLDIFFTRWHQCVRGQDLLCNCWDNI